MTGLPNRIPFGITGNNNNSALESSSRQSNGHLSASRHCKILEEFIKKQNAELSHKRRVHEEMKSLIGWLKKDLMEAEETVRRLEQEKGISEDQSKRTEEDTAVDSEDKVQRKGEGKDGKKDELELLQEIEKNEEAVKETIGNHEAEIGALQRENESYLSQLTALRDTVKQQAQYIKKDKITEEELKNKLQELLSENDSLNSELSQYQNNSDGVIGV